MNEPASILIVEDEPAIADVLGEFVRRLGFRPLVMMDPQTVAPAFSRHRPVLAILDYMLPGMDGGQLFSLLRGMPGGAQTPVIFVTAVPVNQLEQAVRDKRNVRFMQKPLDFAVMARHFRELLGEAPVP